MTAITAPRFAVLTRASALTTRETVAAETPARRAMSRIVKDDFAGPDRARMGRHEKYRPCLCASSRRERAGACPARSREDLEDESDLELDVARRPHGGHGAESARVHELPAGVVGKIGRR